MGNTWTLWDFVLLCLILARWPLGDLGDYWLVLAAFVGLRNLCRMEPVSSVIQKQSLSEPWF